MVDPTKYCPPVIQKPESSNLIINQDTFRSHLVMYAIRNYSTFSSLEDPFIKSILQLSNIKGVSANTYVSHLSLLTATVKDNLKMMMERIDTEISLIIDIY
ncbi:hypothetical protein ACTFIZ_006732 [Dictyostelium cf. discoideum]